MIGTILSALLFAAAAVFGTVGIFGLFTFPDAYTRLHAGSLASTTAVFTVLLGLLPIMTDWHFTARIIIILLFFIVSSPTGSHVVMHLVWNSGVLPWKKRGTRT